MAVSKVILDGVTLMDVTSATAVATDIRADDTAMIADGTMAVGTLNSYIPSAAEKDVVYIDYDGKILYSYTAAEFANLSAHPAHPQTPYSFLTANDWNWTLAGAKTYVAKYKQLVIGQTYTPADNAIFCVIKIPFGREVQIDIKSTANGNNITVDWGDSTTPDSQTNVANNTSISFTHTYTSGGEYYIKLTHTGTVNLINRLFRAGSDVGAGSSYVKDIFIGTGVSFNGNTFRYFNANVGLSNSSGATNGSMFEEQYFKGFVFPAGMTGGNANSNWFSKCYCVEYISYPEGFEYSGGNYNYSNCKNLRKICTDDVRTWNSNVFNECNSLQRINVPACVTLIKASTFSNCYALLELHFYGTTPPTIDNSNAFNNLPTTCTIYVPTGYLSDYTSATSYPDPNTYTYVEE